MALQTTAAFGELLELLRTADANFLAGERAVGDEVYVAEGYRFLTQVLEVAAKIYLFADPARPEMVPITSPTLKWGGDNSDAFYYFAPVEAAHRYRIRGQRGDACYMSVCVYAGPNDGRWSNRIVSNLNDRSIRFEPDGSFELLVSQTLTDQPQTTSHKPPTNWLALDDEAVALVARDYHVDPQHGHKTTYRIEAIDSASPPPPLDDQTTAARFRAVTNFIRELLMISPLPATGAANTITDVWKVPDITYGWAAPDAHYAGGSFDLQDNEALVIEGRSPQCAYWGMMLWNPFMQTFDYRYERVGINGKQVQYESDGSWRILIAARDPGCPNWVSTAGHRRGRIWFRWFLAEETPPQPVARVIRF
jgi:hypothetical protein